MELIDKQKVIEIISECLDPYGYVDSNKFAPAMRHIFSLESVSKESIINEYRDALLKNDVIDRSVVRRVAEQLKGEENESDRC